MLELSLRGWLTLNPIKYITELKCTGEATMRAFRPFMR